MWRVRCSISNSGSDVAASTCGCKRWHDASLTGYGRSWRDARYRHGLRRVKCHGSVVGQRCLPAKVVQRHGYSGCVADVLGVANELGDVGCVVATIVGWYLEFCENFAKPLATSSPTMFLVNLVFLENIAEISSGRQR
jgi:hypothetical protein